jgi:prephenate dehydrogenase
VEPSRLDPFSTPVFRTKQAIAGKVFGLRSEMYAGILAENPEMLRIIERYEKNLSRLKELLRNGDAAGLAALLKNR